jgi:hypothetical protein
VETRLTRRSLLYIGGLAAVAAGGLVAASYVRKAPGPSVLGAGALPVADVPAPTSEPVEIVYCAGWDPASRTPVAPFSEAVARAQDAAGAQYAAVLLIDGAARAVVEVCWDAHHAEVWNLDDDGRPYRGVAFRRWPDERLRLFEVRSWDHLPKSGDPTFSARVHWDDRKAIDRVGITANMPDGSLHQVWRGWPDWPEESRPPDMTAVPAVDGWPLLAGMTGHRTVRSGPDVVPARFPWRPPWPLRPRYVTELLTEGTRFRNEDGTVHTVKRLDAGSIRLPSGRLIAADPGWLDADTPAFTTTVRPGTYPVDVFQATAEYALTVACRVTITGAPVASWHLALLEGKHELALGDGEYFGNPVDTATLAFVDAAGAAAYPEDKVEAVFSDRDDRDAFDVISDKKTATDLIFVYSSSDGSYPVWIGRAADDTVSCFVADLSMPDLAGATPIG